MSKDTTPPVVIETIVSYQLKPLKNEAENALDNKKFSLDRKAKIIISLVVLIFMLVCAVIVTSVLLSKCKTSTELIMPNNLNNTVGKLHLIKRSEWIAQPPKDVLDDLQLPVNRIVIAHTDSNVNYATQAACVFHVRFIQTFHMESRHWNDIGYNFLVCGDGAAYEGRGWDKVGAHTRGFNVGSVGIAFIGNFHKNGPPPQQLLAAQLLIQEGVRLGKVSPNYKLYGHRQLIPTASPGNKLFEIIKTWPHWADSVD